MQPRMYNMHPLQNIFDDPDLMCCQKTFPAAQEDCLFYDPRRVDIKQELSEVISPLSVYKEAELT